MRILFFLFSLLFVNIASSQSFNRIEAEFTLKESDRHGNKKLSVGKVYYDKNYRVVVFSLNFPYEEKLCINDRGVYRIKADTLYSFTIAHGLIDFNIFHLFLNGDLEYYGLSKSSWRLTDVEQADGLIISTWYPPQNYPKGGKMLLSQENKHISGLLSYNDEDSLTSKFVFEEYIEIYGRPFPTQVIQFIYHLNEKEIRLSNYRNFKINQYENDTLYKLPDWLD